MVYTFLDTSTEKKEEIINQNFILNAAFSIYGVIDRTLSAPPETPSSYGLYIPKATATGAWEKKEDTLAWWSGNGYLFLPPVEGMMIKSRQDPTILKYLSGTWEPTVIANAVLSTITASRDIAQSDNGFLVECDSGNDINITLVTENIKPGFNCTLLKKNSGNVSLITPNDVTLESVGTSLTEQFTAAYLTYKGNNFWLALGALS